MLIGGNKKFAIIGLAGYIAPRHLEAMKTLGCHLVCSHDISDSVGIIDRYFPDTRFTTDYNAFQSFINTEHVDFLSVCTPNYLHSRHSVMGMHSGADVICEKPLALSVAELDLMKKVRRETGHRIHPILQLRLHPEIMRLREMVAANSSPTVYDIDLTYITPRGAWYMSSWKGMPEKSGGLFFNIGVHFIDMLQWIFGEVRQSTVHYSEADCIAGFLMFDKARVRYLLSINRRYLPEASSSGAATYRHLSINGSDFDFSRGFTNLHTLSYEKILKGEGFSIEDAEASIDAIETIRTSRPTGLTDDFHPFLLNARH